MRTTDDPSKALTHAGSATCKGPVFCFGATPKADGSGYEEYSGKTTSLLHRCPMSQALTESTSQLEPEA